MAQNQNIPRRLWKIETTHRGVATHSLRTTALQYEMTVEVHAAATAKKSLFSGDLVTCKANNNLHVYRKAFSCFDKINAVQLKLN